MSNNSNKENCSRFEEELKTQDIVSIDVSPKSNFRSFDNLH